LPVDPFHVIWRAVRIQASSDAVNATVARLGAREARLHPRSRVNRFGFSPRERGVVDVLRAKPQPLPTLVQTGLLPERELKKVLYALIITRHLDLGSGALPIGVEVTSILPTGSASDPPRNTASIPSPPPAAAFAPKAPAHAAKPAPAPAQPSPTQNASPEVEAMRREIRDRAERVGSQNYYQILGVAQD